MHFQKLSFKNPNGERLGARLDEPDTGSPTAYAIFAHCFTCTKNLKAILNINRALTDRGIAVLRFDFTGLGESEGDFAETNFTTNVSDLIESAKFLEDEYQSPYLLIGHSLGGAAVLQAASSIPSARAVVTIGAPCEPRYLRTIFRSNVEEIEQKGAVEIDIGGRPFNITKQFLDDLDARSMSETIDRLGRALLIFHSPQDKIVGIDNAAHIFQSAKHPKSFVSLDRADHLLLDEKDSTFTGAVIASWAERYIL